MEVSTTEKTTKKTTKKEVGAVKKPPTPQISLTFKRNSPIEMELYNHLQNKFYQGAYIKELLINQMLRERPDLAEKYNITVPIEAAEPQPQKPVKELTATYNTTTGETTFNDEVTFEPFIPSEEVEQQDETSNSLDDGLMATLGQFL